VKFLSFIPFALIFVTSVVGREKVLFIFMFLFFFFFSSNVVLLVCVVMNDVWTIFLLFFLPIPSLHVIPYSHSFFTVRKDEENE